MRDATSQAGRNESHGRLWRLGQRVWYNMVLTGSILLFLLLIFCTWGSFVLD